jgi:hypothetical protein
VNALARAHRWKRLQESGRLGSLTELATTEKIDSSYLGKMLRLTLLAPDIVEAILNGRQSAGVRLPVLLGHEAALRPSLHALGLPQGLLRSVGNGIVNGHRNTDFAVRGA